MPLELVIDVREQELKKYFEGKENVCIESLDIGDIIFRLDGVIIFIIERKTVRDLSASICDGRSREQKARLLGSGIDRARIMYLIEGNIETKTNIKGGTSTLVGSMINTQFRDGIKVYKTISLNETIFFVQRLYEKLNKDGKIYWKYEDNNNISTAEYGATLKLKKKENMTPKLWFHTQLTLIPQVTGKVASSITKEYPTLNSLINIYTSINDEKKNMELLKNLTYESNGKMRKIGPKNSQRIYEYINN